MLCRRVLSKNVCIKSLVFILTFTLQPLLKSCACFLKFFKCQRTLKLPVSMVGTTTLVALASYGFLKNFSPDAQYFSDYLTGSKNFTRAEVTQEIYPVAAYCDIIVVFVALLVTDFLQHKPIIVMGTASLIGTKALMYYGNTVVHMQLAEMFYAISKASCLGYNSYIYTQIEKDKYQFATSILCITPKLSTMLSAFLSQILLFFQLASLDNLIQITMAALFLALLLAVTLPSSNHSAKNNRKPIVHPTTKQEISGAGVPEEFKEQAALLWIEFKSTYSNPYLLRWCIYSVVSYGLFEMVYHYYAQALWSEVSGSMNNIYNAMAFQVYIVTSMTGSYIIGKVDLDLEQNTDLILAASTLLQGGFIFISAFCESITCAYAYYIIYATTFDVSTVLYRAEMARHLNSFGLIFGIDLFLGLVLQSFLTVFLTTEKGLALSIRSQFSAIGGCFMVLSAAFMMRVISQWGKPRCSTAIQRNTIHISKETVVTHL